MLPEQIVINNRETWHVLPSRKTDTVLKKSSHRPLMDLGKLLSEHTFPILYVLAGVIEDVKFLQKVTTHFRHYSEIVCDLAGRSGQCFQSRWTRPSYKGTVCELARRSGQCFSMFYTACTESTTNKMVHRGNTAGVTLTLGTRLLSTISCIDSVETRQYSK